MKYRVGEIFLSYLVLLQMVGLAIPLFWNLNLSMSCILFLCVISGGRSTDVTYFAGFGAHFGFSLSLTILLLELRFSLLNSLILITLPFKVCGWSSKPHQLLYKVFCVCVFEHTFLCSILHFCAQSYISVLSSFYLTSM